jgi:hypothetical protein
MQRLRESRPGILSAAAENVSQSGVGSGLLIFQWSGLGMTLALGSCFFLPWGWRSMVVVVVVVVIERCLWTEVRRGRRRRRRDQTRAYWSIINNFWMNLIFLSSEDNTEGQCKWDYICQHEIVESFANSLATADSGCGRASKTQNE